MLKNSEGQTIPQVSFPTMQNGQWKNITSNDLFANKTVILFALPGAFTPTCSSAHVPRYSELFPVFKKNGVDEIICLSVNDTFVMNAWKKDQKAENITFLPDGNGEFSEKMGLLVNKENIGFGKRSWRYSMLVKNGVIEKMFIEADVDGDPFDVSDANTMLDYINPNAELPKEVTIITKPGCPHCTNAKKLLTEKGLSFEEITLGEHATTRSLRAITAQSTVPQIYIDGQHIGGNDDLIHYLG